jgi:predicted nucleotidyltransferase component of viral defense system
MNKLIEELKNIISQHSDASDLYKRNLLKDFLQILVLQYIYSHEKYNQLIFYGGSVLAHCYELPRLSEDLDFVDIKGKLDNEQLAEDLKKYFKEEFNLTIKIKNQKFRIYLKFPILQELELSSNSETDLLFVKVEIFKHFNFCKKYKVETVPLFKYNKSLLIKTFDLPTLFATKMRAILYRQWQKTGKDGNVLINVKGRDYFDLMWYLQKNIEINLKCLEINEKEELKNKLLKIISRLDTRSIILDLENFIADKKFTKDLGKNIKDILKNLVENKL